MFVETSANAGAPCQYDEGSPLVQIIQSKPTVVGIMSKNKGCSVDLPSVYTRLSVYYAWFIQTAGTQQVDDTTVPTPDPEITDPVTTEGAIITTELVTEEITTIAEEIVTTEETSVSI